MDQEWNELDVITVEAVLQCKWNRNSKVLNDEILQNKELLRSAKSCIMDVAKELESLET